MIFTQQRFQTTKAGKALKGERLSGRSTRPDHIYPDATIYKCGINHMLKRKKEISAPLKPARLHKKNSTTNGAIEFA
ncbi:MAG: hypothetical protein C0469_09925 [Cyanobacteria bacterium DS2.3.42]|nr:hypothetical protein [Cyanobacteria bacterium DS2.3.42]